MRTQQTFQVLFSIDAAATNGQASRRMTH
jgi:hypothetical protein